MSTDNRQSEPHADQATRRFVPLFAANQKRIYGLIRTLVINPVDAEDLLQATSLVLWEKFAEYEDGTDFAAWSFKIARNLVLNHWRKQGTQARNFDAGVFDVIIDEVAAWDKMADARAEALRECMGHLNEQDRELVQMRYADNADASKLAAHVQRSSKTVYRMLGRIHNVLLTCIRRKLGERD